MNAPHSGSRLSDNRRRRKSFLQGHKRRLFAEQLETRVLLAGDVLHNFDDPFDTDANGVFTPADILHIINQLNQPSTPASGESGGPGNTTTYFNDVTGDGYVSPIDALHTINEYTARAEGADEPIVRFRIQAVDVGTNNVINTSNPSGANFHPINKGTDYELRVLVQDLRIAGGPDGPPDGVYAAYLDLLYDKLKTVVEIQEIQTVTFNNNPEGGTFTLSFDPDGAGPIANQTTANISYNLSGANPDITIASNMQSALNTKFGANTFIVSPVSSGDATKFTVRFMGQFGDKDVPLLTANASGLTSSTAPPNPTITVAETVKGVYNATSFLEAFRFSPQYGNQKRAFDGQISPFADPNRIDEAGAFAVGTATLGSAVRELFRVRMNSIDGGTVAFTGSVANMVSPNDDTLVYGGAHDFPVSASEIEIINTTPFTISEPFSAVNDTYTFAETTANTPRTLTVMTNSGGGQDTGNLTGVTISAISTTSLPVGSLAIASGNTSITFTQLANINNAGAPSTFTYTLRNNSTGVTDTATVTLNVTAVNNAPVATVPASPLTTPEEAPLAITGVSVADIDAAETANANVQAALSVQNGTLTLGTVPAGLTFPVGGNGAASMTIQGSLADVNTALASISYLPSLNFVGADTFRIIPNDMGNTGTPGPLTDNETVTINVTAVNDAPTLVVASDDTVLEGDPLVLIGTSTNDVDVGASPLLVSLSVTGDPAAILSLGSTTGLTFTAGKENGKSVVEFTGTLANVNAALGSFTYTPPLGDAGTQIITITVNDQGATGSGGAKSVTDDITITVDPLVRPFARRDPTPGNAASLAAFTVAEGSSNTGLPVLDNDLVDDPAGGPVTDKLLISVTDAPHGTTSVSGDLVLYTPDADFWGTDTFTYVMNQDVDGNATPDGTNSTGTVTVTITNVNDTPVAVNDSLNVNEDTTIDIDVVANDTDADNNNNAGPLGVPVLTTLTPTIVGGPVNGTASVVGGKIRYRGNQDFFGADTIRYTVSDGVATSNTATVSITIDPVNDAPVAQNGTLTTAEDTGTTGTLVATDVDSPSLTYSLVSSANAHGTVLITNPSTGAYSYTPDLNYNFAANGPASFTFKANDGSLDSNVATVTITVSAVNDPPVATPDSYVVEEDTLLNANNTTLGHPRATVRVNDTDVDNTLASLTVSLESAPTHALTFNLSSDGSFTYQATLDYQGPDSFVYRLTDPSGGFSTATVSITVTEKNDPPVAVNDSYLATEDVLLTVNTAAGVRDGAGLDDDPDGNNPNSSLQVVLVSSPSHAKPGTFVLNSDGSFEYQGADNYNGPDSFRYKLIDPFAAESNIATVSISVAAVNDNPTANDDGSLANPLTLIKNTLANPFINQEINVLANDNNSPDFNVVENLTIISAGGAGGATQHGTVTISGDLKKILYTPELDYEGTDQFTYTISDGNGGTATATVFINVVNFIPTDITGTVFIDSNNNGLIDSSEKRLAGVKVTLQGHDDIFDIDFGADTDSNPNNNVAALVVFTDINGYYRFDAPGSLRPGMRPGSYTITQEQPAFMRDGIDTAGNNATLVANDRMSMVLPLLGITGGINGNNFGERGLDPAYVSVSDILASGTGNGLIMAIDGENPLWYSKLAGWTNLKSCSVTLSADTATATFTFTDMQNNSYTRTISQTGNPRFRLMGRTTDGKELIRLDGAAADFGLTLLAAAGNTNPQPEGEADLPEGEAGYVRNVDAIMAEVGIA